MKRCIVLAFLLVYVSPAIAGKRIDLAMTTAAPIIEAGAVVKAAYEKLGYEVVLHPLPARRAMSDMLSGQLAGDVGRMNGLEKRYKEIVRIDVPVNSIDGMAFTCDKTIHIRDKKDLEGYRIGIRSGIKFSERLTKGLNPISVESWEKLFDMLQRGRIDVVIAYRGIERKMEEKLNLDCLQLQEPPIETHLVYHYLNKGNQDIVPAITATLRKMLETGETGRILGQNSFPDKVQAAPPLQ